MKSKALLAVSFGTSFYDSCKKSIEATENALSEQFPDYDLKRAFTSRMIIRKLRTRDGIHIDTPRQALEELLQSGYREVLIQPLHILAGIEFETLASDLAPYVQQFGKFSLGRPLLAGAEDCEKVVDAFRDELPAMRPDEALVLMGHGTLHPANAAYAHLECAFNARGFKNVFVATVEGAPTLDAIIPELKARNIRKITLMPFMLVAGDHAQNDIAGDDDESWKSILGREGFNVSIRLVGLGEMPKIRQVYIDHACAALKSEGG